MSCLVTVHFIVSDKLCLFSFTDYSVYIPAESKMLCAWLNCHTSYSIYRSIFKPSHSLFMSVRQTLSFFPRDIDFNECRCTWQKQNTSESLPYFSWVFSLSFSLECNDTLYHSRVFSISFPGLKEIDLKGLEQVKKCGLNFNLGIKSKDHLRLNHSQRVPGAATQTLMRATWLKCVGFYK